MIADTRDLDSVAPAQQAREDLWDAVPVVLVLLLILGTASVVIFG